MPTRLWQLRRRRLAVLATLAGSAAGPEREAARAELAAVDLELDSYGQSGELVKRETDEEVSRA
jgi:hypothetical protein